MTAHRLGQRAIHKIWGRRTLGFGFDGLQPDAEPIGEIWFEASADQTPELLVKYLFTSAKLSVQVHPNEAQAQARGHNRGKEECWLILDAEPEAVIGIGLEDEIDSDALREAALDGSIEQLLDWKPVAAGDLFYLPAGTIHAIGAGITLIEIQQNIDLTYRLYDYGRPRALHLDDAVAVANPAPWKALATPGDIAPGRTILAAGRKFVFERWSGEHRGTIDAPSPAGLWLIPIDGRGAIADDPLEPGDVWIATDSSPLTYDGTLLLAYPGGKLAESLLRPA